MMIGTVLLLAGLAVGQNAPEITVDCDAGQSLSRALARADRHPRTTIHVRGTCTGSFVIASQGVSLRGDPSTPTVIQGGPDAIANSQAVLDVTVDHFVMSHLTVRQGWIGVHVRGGLRTNSNVQLLDSIFEDNYGGVLIDGGSAASIRRSTFESNQVGIAVQFGSRGSIVDCDIRNSGITGVDAYQNSLVGISSTTISGSGSGYAGISATFYSSIEVAELVLSESGDVHAIIRDRSRLRTGRNVMFGSATDSTTQAAFVDGESFLQTSSGQALWGDVTAEEGCHLSLEHITVHGSLLLDGFTNAILAGSTIDGIVECTRGSDAFCDSGVTASVSGCVSAMAPCTLAAPAPAETRATPKRPVLRDRLRDLR